VEFQYITGPPRAVLVSAAVAATAGTLQSSSTIFFTSDGSFARPLQLRYAAAPPPAIRNASMPCTSTPLRFR
jgi:hypothetical protein